MKVEKDWNRYSIPLLPDAPKLPDKTLKEEHRVYLVEKAFSSYSSISLSKFPTPNISAYFSISFSLSECPIPNTIDFKNVFMELETDRIEYDLGIAKKNYILKFYAINIVEVDNIDYESQYLLYKKEYEEWEIIKDNHEKEVKEWEAWIKQDGKIEIEKALESFEHILKNITK